MPDAESSPPGDSLGHPRIHLRRTDSTNERARELADRRRATRHAWSRPTSRPPGAADRGAPGWRRPGSALLCSLVLRDPPALLSLIAGVAACDAVGESARVKWPNDVVVERPPEREPATGARSGASRRLAKLAGILVEGRPQEGWAVLGIGVNVAVRVEELPAEVRAGAASLQRPRSAIEPLLADLLAALARRRPSRRSLLEAWRARDALYGRDVAWDGTPPAPRARARAR